MPEVEVAANKVQADLAKLAQLAGQTQVPVLKNVLEEVLALENGGRIRKHLSVPASGWARRYMHLDGSLHYDIAYQSEEPDEALRLGNLVHELTHCAVNEAYHGDFLNHACSDDGVPAMVLNANRFVENETARRSSRMDMTVLGYLGENLNTLQRQLTQSGLSEAHKKEVADKIDYGKVNVYAEYDTVINQIGFWCLEWNARRGTQFAKLLDALGEDAYERRQGNAPVTEAFPDPALQARCCYITTACTQVMGLADDCEVLTTLRSFRDGWLVNQSHGAKLVERYYQHAPRIVAAIEQRADSDRVFQEMFKTKIEPAARLAQNGHCEEAFEVYVSAIRELEGMASAGN